MSLDATSQFSPVLTQPDSSISAQYGFDAINGVTVRNLKDTPEDAEFAARLTVEAFREKLVHSITERKLPIAVKNLTANYRGQNQAFYNRIFVAEQDCRPVGLLQLLFKGDTQEGYMCLGCADYTTVDKSYKCYVDHVCVDESARGRGIGKVLMQRAEHEARARNCSMMYLSVSTTNRARNLYERQGYHITKTKSCCGCLRCCTGPPGAFYEMEKTLQ